MSESSGSGGDSLSRLVHLCEQLKLSESAQKTVVESFKTVSRQCSLEGDDSPWLVCCIYVANNFSEADETDEKSDISGSQQLADKGVPLMKLLKVSGVSLLEFFDHLKKWMQMSSLSTRVTEKILKVESKFAVAAVLFKKFRPIFNSLFDEVSVDLSADSPQVKTRSGKKQTPRKNKENQSGTLSTRSLFDFTWSLFAFIKGSFPSIADDLVNSFHLLICVIDFLYSNVVDANRLEFLKIKPNDPRICYGSGEASNEENSENVDTEGAKQYPCVIDFICQEHMGIAREAKRIRTYWWQPKIKSLVTTKKSLYGSVEPILVGFLDPGNFQKNCKEVDKMYAKHLAECYGVDERIFLTEDNGAYDIGSPSKTGTERMIDTDFMLRKSVQACLDRVNHCNPQTPLTGSRYMTASTEDFTPATPVASATNAISRLLTILCDSPMGPSPELEKIFSDNTPNPSESIVKRLGDMSDAFRRASDTEEMKSRRQGYDRSSSPTMGAEGDVADAGDFVSIEQKLELTEILYYRILEKIIALEKKRMVGQEKDLGVILSQDLFHRSLYGCCLEVVMFCYNSASCFKWIMDVLGVAPFHFYKVIELFIRCDSEFSRDILKHMNMLEERILEELAWVSDSPFWQIASKPDFSVPSCEDVMLPSHTSTAPGYMTPLGVGGRFQTPIKTPLVAKRRLDFEATGSGMPAVKKIAVESGVLGGPTQIRISKIQLPKGEVSVHSVSKVVMESPGKEKERKSGSTALFFRKVYTLANVRLKDLCERLNASEKLQQLSWTMFERVLQKETELMKDRHLDQILMSSLYVMAKISREDKSFQEIMRCYRMQPQAKSRVYRSVLLDSKSPSPYSSRKGNGMSEDDSSSNSSETDKGAQANKLRSPSTMPVPAILSAPPTPTPNEEERGDLIKFYNLTFIKKVDEFARSLCPSGDGTSSLKVPMSPLPPSRSHPASPRRKVAEGIFVSPMKSGLFPMSPARPLSYSFNRSPYKDLKAINKMLKGPDVPEVTTSGATRRLNMSVDPVVHTVE